MLNVAALEWNVVVAKIGEGTQVRAGFLGVKVTALVVGKLP